MTAGATIGSLPHNCLFAAEHGTGDFGLEQDVFRGEQTPFVRCGSSHGSHSVKGNGGLGPELSRKVIEELRESGDARVVEREVAGVEIVFAAVLTGAGGGLSQFRYHPGLIVHGRRSEFGALFL